jgi:hypothetical protein
LVNEDNTLSVSDIKLYTNWNSCKVGILTFIEQINLKDKDSAFIEKVLENQFAVSQSLYDNPYIREEIVPVSNHPNDIFSKLNTTNVGQIRKKILNKEIVLDKSTAQSLLYVIATSPYVKGDLKIYKLLICSGADINYKYFSNMNILDVMALGEYFPELHSCIQLLINLGMDINHNSKISILDSPIFNKDIKLLELLINLGANVNFINDLKLTEKGRCEHKVVNK